MSCLFQSLSAFVKIDPDSLRKQICSFLSADEILIQPDMKVSDAIKFQPDIPSMSLEQYTYIMSLQNTNGGAIEIRAFCALYNLNVRVLQCGPRQGGKPIEFIFKDSLPWITISWNGGHYEPVTDYQSV